MKGIPLFKFGLLWVLILNPHVNKIFAQEFNTLKGFVVDMDSGDPIPYALVGVPKQQRGISASINGYFQLILPEVNKDHHLQISSIGYERLSLPLSEIDWDREQRFELKLKPTVLDEVVVTGKSYTVEELVKHASKNRKVYLRSKPYLMNGFYREVLKIRDEYQGITEAQGILYMNGYNPGYKNNNDHLTYDLAQWKHIRRSNYPDQEKGYLEIGALLKAKDYYLHDGPLHRNNLNKFHYTISDTSLYQDRLVLVIDFSPKEAFAKSITYHGRLYIKEDDQALLNLEVEASGPHPFLRNTESKSGTSSHFEVSFLLFDGQYYLNHTSFQRLYTRDGNLINWTSELIGASFSNQGASFLNYNHRVVLYSEMLNPLINYDPTFWNNFIFSQGADFKKISDLHRDIEQQFQNNHNKRLIPLPDGIGSYQQMATDRNALDFILQY